MDIKESYYITGFADDQGSFNTSFGMRDNFLIGWKITPVFNISQKQRDILVVIINHLNYGTLRLRNHGVWVYQVDNTTVLNTIITTFFEKFPFLSTKKNQDFIGFIIILKILKRYKSQTLLDVQDILVLFNEI